jgi:hypothetical protein
MKTEINPDGMKKTIIITDYTMQKNSEVNQNENENKDKQMKNNINLTSIPAIKAGLG